MSTLKLPISPSTRWVLACLFLNKGLSLNGGISQDVIYNRSRAALGLRGPMSAVIKAANPPKELVHNGKPNAYVELTQEVIEFLADKIWPLEKHPFQVTMLEQFIDDIQAFVRHGLTPGSIDLPHVNTLTENWIVNEEKEGK